MSSGFVSASTTDNPIERDDEWLKAQQEVEANRRRKEEESRQQGGKTLYDVLQSNKAAKQDAFEESIRLKNQFRNLDEDEVEFLDSVLESTRKQEEAVKKQTSEQLDLFRRQQEEADRAAIEGDGELKVDESSQANESEENWTVNRGKRKRAEEKTGLPGFKLRKSSSSSSTQGGGVMNACATSPSVSPHTKASVEPQLKAKESFIPSSSSSTPMSTIKKSADSAVKPTTANTLKLGLSGYSSDEED